MVHAEVVSGLEDISRYADLWREMYQRHGNEPSTSYEWTDALLSTHRSEEDRLLLVVLKKAQETTGLVPIIMSPQKSLGQTLVNLFPISEYYNTHSDLLLKEYTEETIHAFLRSLLDSTHPWDIFRMKRLIATGPLLPAIETVLRETGTNYRLRTEEPSFFLTLDGTYQDYLGNRSAKFRNYLKRIQRKMDLQGSVALRTVEHYGSVDAAYEDLLEIERKSWKHGHGTAISAVERQEDFYRRLCRETHKSGRLHLSFLTLDDRPIAYNLGHIHRKKYAYLKTSFDESLRPLSPSTVLRARLIEALIADGVQHFDFPAEPYEWERQWSKELRWHSSLTICNNTLKGKLYSVYWDMKNKARPHSGGKEVRYHNPRNLKARRKEKKPASSADNGT